MDISVIAILVLGIALFRDPRRARIGNWTAAIALSGAVLLVLWRHGVVDPGTVLLALLLGAIAGDVVARAANMIQIPSIVAFQHGAGGVAAFLVALVELTRGGHALPPANAVSGVLGLVIGSLTFSASMIASAKLANRLRQAPQTLPGHTRLLLANAALLVIAGAASFAASAPVALVLHVALILLAASLGILVAIRVGGADMPVLISFLNATAGLAAALCGMVIENQLLIAFGATVAASGSILTVVMCKAMNRSILRIFLPRSQAHPTPAPAGAPAPSPPGAAGSGKGTSSDNGSALDKAAAVLKAAREVVVVPGYGMAVAQAQQEVAALANRLAAMGKAVRYAIHPVAGRMPGHMNVLLAEAGVDYDMLVEMEAINPRFETTDAVVVVGACDVVNPAAIEKEDTPISGMPILMVHQAQNVVCCNWDLKPGYSGIDNPLYLNDRTIMLCGNAKDTVHRLAQALQNGKPESAVAAPPQPDHLQAAVQALTEARQVTVIPGYGMALAQAQFKVVELAGLLSRNGATVKYAIHPVAGRMPGHMNVILAEAEVNYDDLLEMDDANLLFKDTDVALVVGACDVVNPAAIEREGTPISGMPILLAHEARNVVVCNFDTRPGYSGVPNPLYENDRTIGLFGDAQQTLGEVIAALKSHLEKAERLYFELN